MKKKYVQFIVGVLLFYGFTQIQLGEFLFGEKINEEEIDNSALFYTESEKARAADFFMKKRSRGRSRSQESDFRGQVRQ